MRRNIHKISRKTGPGKLVAAILVGGVVGATVGWLTAPASGEETRRRFWGDRMSARERIKTSQGNVESRARELAEDLSSTSVGF